MSTLGRLYTEQVYAIIPTLFFPIFAVLLSLHLTFSMFIYCLFTSLVLWYPGPALQKSTNSHHICHGTYLVGNLACDSLCACVQIRKLCTKQSHSSERP